MDLKKTRTDTTNVKATVRSAELADLVRDAVMEKAGLMGFPWDAVTWKVEFSLSGNTDPVVCVADVTIEVDHSKLPQEG